MRSSFLTTLAPAARWTGQGVVVGSIFGPSPAATRWAVDAVGSAFGETNDSPTLTGEVVARAFAGTGRLGGAVGGGAGGTTHAASSNLLYQVLGDGWWSAGDERLSISAALTSTHAAFTDSSRFALTLRPVSYTDLAAGWQHERGGLSFGASGGVRGQGSMFDGADSWGSVEATAWIAPRAAIVASAGRTLADVVRGVPSARYLTVAVRISNRPHLTLVSRPRELAGPQLTIESGGASVRSIEIRVATAV
ncbi:MAG: hypothetical protein ACHQWU_13795, partial [Gemmatimonadales bacterium]